MALRLASRCFRPPMVLTCKRTTQPIASKLATCCSQSTGYKGVYEKTSVASYVTSSGDNNIEDSETPASDVDDEVNLLHDVGAEMKVESLLMKNHIANDFDLDGIDETLFPTESPFEVDDMLLQDLQASVETLVSLQATEDVLVQDTQVHSEGVEMNIESIMMNTSAIESGEDKYPAIPQQAASIEVGGGSELNVDSLMMEEASEEHDENDDYPQTDDEIRTQILTVALDNVPLFGWTAQSIEKAVEMLKLSPSSSDLFKKGGLDLVLFFIEEGNNALVEHIAAEAKKVDLKSEEARTAFIEQAIKTRLQMIIPYIETWPQAMKLMASPGAAKEIFENGANLLDEILYHSGDFSTDMSWYAKRGVLTGINLSTELFMLNDKSHEYRDTWAFLHRRMQEAKTLHYAKDSIANAANDTLALASAGVTLAQNILGLNKKQR